GASQGRVPAGPVLLRGPRRRPARVHGSARAGARRAARRAGGVAGRGVSPHALVANTRHGTPIRQGRGARGTRGPRSRTGPGARGRAQGAIVMLNTCEADCPALSATRAPNENVPAAVGVPEMTLPLSRKPGGSRPETMVQL